MVSGNCKFNAPGSTALTIATGAGVIDPSAAGPATGSVGVAFKCTTGTTSTITADGGVNSTGPGARRVKRRSGLHALFAVHDQRRAGGFGLRAGQDKTVTVDASVAAVDY